MATDAGVCRDNRAGAAAYRGDVICQRWAQRVDPRCCRGGQLREVRVVLPRGAAVEGRLQIHVERATCGALECGVHPDDVAVRQPENCGA